MRELDTQVGENVARARGNVSQKDLAVMMKDRGWRWSQATVWSVEKGERPLRLSEAGDLASILDVRLEDLLSDPESNRLRMARQTMHEVENRLTFETRVYLDAQSNLAEQASTASLDADRKKVLSWWLRRTPAEIVTEATAEWATGRRTRPPLG